MIWQHGNDWYAARSGELSTCMNTKEAAEELLALRSEVAHLRGLVSVKDEALVDYAEFYDKAASLCGLGGALPSRETDEVILDALKGR